MLANLKEAAIWRSKNDLHNALNIYKNILGNNIEQVYKNYVQIQLVEVLMELGNLEEAKIILSDVSITNTAFASLAKEYIGYIAMQEGDLIIFPSYIPHRAVKVLDEGRKTIISANYSLELLDKKFYEEEINK